MGYVPLVSGSIRPPYRPGRQNLVGTDVYVRLPKLVRSRLPPFRGGSATVIAEVY
jgi:hypothetical protein